MRLFVDPKSTASMRVLACVAYKRLNVPVVEIALASGKHWDPHFVRHNPGRTVPVLVDPQGRGLAQSAAIIEFLDTWAPDPPVLPDSAWLRARVRAFCGLIGADAHPLTNLRVRKALASLSGQGEALVAAWCQRWTDEALQACEAELARQAGAPRYAFGATPGMADFFLAPFLLSARRFRCSLHALPRLQALEALYAQTECLPPALRQGLAPPA